MSHQPSIGVGRVLAALPTDVVTAIASPASAEIIVKRLANSVISSNRVPKKDDTCGNLGDL